MGTLYRIVGALGVCAAIAVVVCYLTSIRKDESNDNKSPPPTMANRLVDGIKAENIAKTMRFINTNGAPNYFRTADSIESLWRDAGLSDVHSITYDVNLPIYNASDPNSLTIIRADNESDIVRYLENHERSQEVSAINFIPYSAIADVAGDVLYSNQGTAADFQTLDVAGITVKGQIALCRYEPGDSLAEKIFNAQAAGAIGALIFADVLRDVNGSNPSGIGLNYIIFNKIKLALASAQPPPFYSAKRLHDDFSVENDEILKSLLFDKNEGITPTIPALFISRAVAEQILNNLGGPEAPDEWQGVIYGKYHIGPSSNNKRIKLRIQITAKYEKREIQNVIGYLMGATEPDNYVIVGSGYSDEHSTSFGDSSAVNSGAATLVELARVFGVVSRTADWRPTRTIMFCAWGADDYGAIGSREFIGDFLNILRQRSVVYIHVDNLIEATVNCSGHLDISCTPMLYNEIDEAARHDRTTVQTRAPRYGGTANEFINTVGVSSATVTYRGNDECQVSYSKSNNNDMSTLHKSQQSLGRFLAQLTRSLSDDEFLPLSVISYASEISEKFKSRKLTTEELVNESNSSANSQPSRFQYLQGAAAEFLKAAEAFEHEHIQRRTDALTSDRINERLKSVERCFIDVASRRHILFDVIERADGNVNAIDMIFGQNLDIGIQDEQMLQYALDCATDTLEIVI